MIPFIFDQLVDIERGAAAWENVDKPAVVCPSYNYHEADFMQMYVNTKC